MAVQQKQRSLGDVVEDFGGLYECESAARGLLHVFQQMDKTRSELMRTVEAAMNDRGRVLKSKLDLNSVRSRVGTLQSYTQDAQWERMELDSAIDSLEREIEELAAIVEA